MNGDHKAALNNMCREETASEGRKSTEDILTTIWKEVLKTEKVGVHDDFLALGGQSLLAMSVINRVREKLGVEVPVETLLGETPTIEKLSNKIDEFIEGEKWAIPPSEHEIK